MGPIKEEEMYLKKFFGSNQMNTDFLAKLLNPGLSKTLHTSEKLKLLENIRSNKQKMRKIFAE